jgi:quinoprotein glucose dehydrogenase
VAVSSNEWVRRGLLAILGLCGAWVGCDPSPLPPSEGPAVGWPSYGGDVGGTRYSSLSELTPANVGRLEVAWEFHTGDLFSESLTGRNHAFQATPILHEDTLYLCTPRSWVIAVQAETGTERWRFDPQVDLEHGHYTLNCRGVAAWTDVDAAPDAGCRTRIFVATADTRLIALDSDTGAPCAGFGDAGEVPFFTDVAMRERREYSISSPPVVVDGVVVVGSSVAESARVDMPSGKVHAFDARTGAPRWTWDPVPRDPADPARATWEGSSADSTGGANVWSLVSVDVERGLVFLPTSSPSPDYYGGERLGDNRHADSVVALRAATGERVWSFQAIHHNVWDYDVGSQPVLLELPGPGGGPAVAQATKVGHLFFLDRETGRPLIPVEERPVPASDVPGERAAPTQPFPRWPPPLAPHGLRPDEVWGLTFWDRNACRDRIAAMRSEGAFTPPSFEGTVLFPGVAGGVNWGSVAFDPERKLLLAASNRVLNSIRLARRDASHDFRDDLYEISSWPMRGTPYVAYLGVVLSPFGIPCNPPPWGTLVALDLETREIAWEVTLGTTEDLAPLGVAIAWGTPHMGGPIVTGGGLAFIGATMDSRFRAFDLATGEEVWSAKLPAGGQATPMTYRVREDGRQFVVIAAGGHASLRTRRGDSLVAYALP